jgi:hypothetical protein
LIVIQEEWPLILKNKGILLHNPNNQDRIKFVSKIRQDDEELRKLLNKSANNDHDSRIYKNFQYIKKWLKKEVSGFNIEETNDWFNKFFQKMSQIEISTNVLGEENDMFQVFQSINAKLDRLTLYNLLNNFICSFEEENGQIISL